jgi:hypothetical protein
MPWAEDLDAFSSSHFPLLGIGEGKSEKGGNMKLNKTRASSATSHSAKSPLLAYVTKGFVQPTKFPPGMNSNSTLGGTKVDGGSLHNSN